MHTHDASESHLALDSLSSGAMASSNMGGIWITTPLSNADLPKGAILYSLPIPRP